MASPSRPQRIQVFGHKNPDTDSVIAAIALAELQNQRGMPSSPKVQGSPNPETNFVMQRFKFSLTPMILGLVLGSMAEENLRQSMVIAAAKSVNLFSYIVLRPISIVIIVLIALLIWGNFKTRLRGDE